MEREFAELVQERSHLAIRTLSELLELGKGKCNEAEYEELRRGIGLTIGRIQMEILEVVVRKFPDLDDLA